MLRRLLGASVDDWAGIAPLHTAADAGGALAATPGFTPALVPLFQDVAGILDRVAQPVARALERYVDLTRDFLGILGRELPFYLGAVRLVRALRKLGLPVCRPEFAPKGERVCEVQAGYNLNLALQSPGEAVVVNDVSLGPDGRIIILTGPNRGGKTTYVQGIGLIQPMAQAGLFVPGESARLSPADGISTHFPTEENPAAATGRLGDEAVRVHAIFERATRHSLVLLNEALASTSPGESLYLAQDLVRVLRLLGARAVFPTHMHELAAGSEALNSAGPGDSPIVSVVSSPAARSSAGDAGSDGAVPGSFKVEFAPPMGRSYAAEIARRYRVSYDQLRAQLVERGARVDPRVDQPGPSPEGEKAGTA